VVLDLLRIVICHDNTGAGPGWFLDKAALKMDKDTDGSSYGRVFSGTIKPDLSQVMNSH